jgi:hypothetical protein
MRERLRSFPRPQPRRLPALRSRAAVHTPVRNGAACARRGVDVREAHSALREAVCPGEHRAPVEREGSAGGDALRGVRG